MKAGAREDENCGVLEKIPKTFVVGDVPVADSDITKAGVAPGVEEKRRADVMSASDAGTDGDTLI